MDTDRGLLSEELNQAVEILAEVFAARSIRYALVGGLATYMLGRVRFTKDVDCLLDVPQIALPGLLDELVRTGFLARPGTRHQGIRPGAHDRLQVRPHSN